MLLGIEGLKGGRMANIWQELYGTARAGGGKQNHLTHERVQEILADPGHGESVPIPNEALRSIMDRARRMVAKADVGGNTIRELNKRLACVCCGQQRCRCT